MFAVRGALHELLDGETQDLGTCIFSPHCQYKLVVVHLFDLPAPTSLPTHHGSFAATIGRSNGFNQNFATHSKANYQ